MVFPLILLIFLTYIHLILHSVATAFYVTSDPVPSGFKPSSCELVPHSNNPWSNTIEADSNNRIIHQLLELPSDFDLCRQIARFTIPLYWKAPYHTILPSIRLLTPHAYWLVYEFYGPLQLFEEATRRNDSKIVYKRHVLAQKGPYPVLDSWMYGTEGEYSEVKFEINIVDEWDWKWPVSEIALYQMGSEALRLESANASNSTGVITWQ